MHCVHFDKISTLGLQHDAQASQLLRRAAELVAPVMSSRGWRVAHLTEFLPRGMRLLGRNWNKGQKVEIRLRESKSDPQKYVSCFSRLSPYRFLPFEAIVGTLLHELVHNSIGPHGKPFKSLLEKITKECEQHIMKSIPVVVDCGYTLGGDTAAYEMYAQKDLARFAAESRLALSIPTPTEIDLTEESKDD